MVRQVGKFFGPTTEILVRGRRLKSRGLGDGPDQCRGGAAAQGVTRDEDLVHVDAPCEFAVRFQTIEQHSQIARPFPPAQETLSAIGLGSSIAVMVHADGNKPAMRQIT